MRMKAYRAGRARPTSVPGPRTLAASLAVLLALPAVPLPVLDGRATLVGQQPDAPARVALARGDSLELIDRAVAIVGDTVILQSEVQEELLRLRSRGVNVPSPESPGFREAFGEVLGTMVEQMILLDNAKRHPELVPSDEEVEEEVDRRFDEIRAQFSSADEMQRQVEAVGMNMFQYRQMLRSQARAEILLRNFQRRLGGSGELPPVQVTETEIQAYFERFGGGELRPATVSFDRIIVDPSPDSAATAEAVDVTRRALDEIRDGTDFEVAARRYSEDEATRASGGDLGWLRRHQVVPAFADMAWAAPLGRAVGPVRTRFGFHVIKVENSRAGERKLRHILVRPEIDEKDIERARERAEALADSLREGADPLRLARRHDLREDEVRFDEVPMSQLLNRFGPDYARQLAEPRSGEVIDPFRVIAETGRPAYVVLRIREFKPEGPYRLDDVRDRIREQLLQQKQFSSYLEDLTRKTYVELLVR